MLIAKCTHCGAVEQVPDDYAGKILECECGYDHDKEQECNCGNECKCKKED